MFPPAGSEWQTTTALLLPPQTGLVAKEADIGEWNTQRLIAHQSLGLSGGHSQNQLKVLAI